MFCLWYFYQIWHWDIRKVHQDELPVGLELEETGILGTNIKDLIHMPMDNY